MELVDLMKEVEVMKVVEVVVMGGVCDIVVRKCGGVTVVT